MNEKIGEILKNGGISLFGFCDFDWVKDRLLDCRAKSRLPENAKTVIICAFPYKVKAEKPKKISRYAAVPDYHRVCEDYVNEITAELQATFPQNRFEWFQDNSPIPEVYAAACAGLGVRGENGLLITKDYGSWVFLGEWVTDLKTDYVNQFSNCIQCGACRKVCPKKSECLSAVTQKKGDLSAEEAALLKENELWWGCDLCAEVCPMNRAVKTEPLPAFADGYRDTFSTGEDIAGRAYAWRGKQPILRNAKIK